MNGCKLWALWARQATGLPHPSAQINPEGCCRTRVISATNGQSQTDSWNCPIVVPLLWGATQALPIAHQLPTVPHASHQPRSPSSAPPPPPQALNAVVQRTSEPRSSGGTSKLLPCRIMSRSAFLCSTSHISPTLVHLIWNSRSKEG